MDSSLDDFDLNPVKKTALKRKPLASLDVNIPVKKKSEKTLKKTENEAPCKLKTCEKAIQCGADSRDKGTQCGGETAVIYKDKLKKAHIRYRTLIQDITPNKRATLDFCFKSGLLQSSRACPTCSKPMSLITDSSVSDGHKWYCRKKSGPNKHEHKISIKNGSFFTRSNLTLEEILQFLYLWISGMSQDYISKELGTCGKTDVDWASFCREVCEWAVMKNSEKIGGDGIVVEIDESKFAKRKYNVGHRVVGGWVFGGRERDNKSKVFMEPVENRTAETLLSIIQKWIAPGSVIWSDCWKSYGKIPELPQGYRHATVNHSKHFVDPETGTCTNRIESDWRHAKAEFPRFGTRPEHYSGYLSVFMWKRKHAEEDLFLAFIQDVILFTRHLGEKI